MAEPAAVAVPASGASGRFRTGGQDIMGGGKLARMTAIADHLQPSVVHVDDARASRPFEGHIGDRGAAPKVLQNKQPVEFSCVIHSFCFQNM